MRVPAEGSRRLAHASSASHSWYLAPREEPVEDIERRVVEVLGRLGVTYEREATDPDYADTGPYCERYAVPPAHAAHTSMVALKKEPRQYAACAVKLTTALHATTA